ncbi:MAG: hypothetical protein ACLPZJ_05405 [Terriglobales bacterium]|jgi:hypothetical protein
MNPYESELFDALQLFGGLLEDLSQRTLALENSLSPADRQRYDKELKRVRELGQSTNVAVALEVLQKRIDL